jgi:hypothetical protein
MPFAGTFDGAGKDIANLYIGRGSDDDVGLFGRANSEIKNVHIRTGSVRGYYCVGGIAAYLGSGGTIESCSNNAALVMGQNWVGGVVGQNFGNITVCSNTGPVMAGGADSEGVAGFNWGNITACSNTGLVTVPNSLAGGVAGWSHGSITACSNIGPVMALYWAGGVTGSNLGNITACSNTGQVTASNSLAGGVASRNQDGGTITACFNTGQVTASTYYTGGVVADYGGIIACYRYGTVTNEYSTAGTVFGSSAWPAGDNDTETAWKIGNANGSGPGNYWKSMGTPSDNPGPNDFPKLWWE